MGSQRVGHDWATFTLLVTLFLILVIQKISLCLAVEQSPSMWTLGIHKPATTQYQGKESGSESLLYVMPEKQ